MGLDILGFDYILGLDILGMIQSTTLSLCSEDLFGYIPGISVPKPCNQATLLTGQTCADSTKRCATDIVWFCGFSLRNAILTRTDTIAGSLLVLTFSEAVVIKAR